MSRISALARSMLSFRNKRQRRTDRCFASMETAHGPIREENFHEGKSFEYFLERGRTLDLVNLFSLGLGPCSVSLDSS
ncbi:hypothetical protein HZH66_015253 [Vespula vulgaris]|uniref:Uncharacterized protein n=2 Tax=Vespula TaxID=7451 RepID=A0A834J1R8_VESVU|nr:hypothetical protein HZH66_015253 [Vespula vulgaris]